MANDDPGVAATDDDAEQEIRRIIQNGNKIQICRVLLQEFCDGCSIQGLKYFCERKRHWSERIFWMIMFATAVVLSCLMIQDSYKKWDQTPVIITLSTKTTSVWRIPFPAVTICPEVKTSTQKINLTQLIHTGTSNETQDLIEAFIQICDNPDLAGLYPLRTYKNETDASFIDMLYDLSIKLEDSMQECDWHNEHANCSSLFRPILTEDGHCYTFNALNSREIYTDEVAPDLLSVTGQPEAKFWNLDDGYSDVKIFGKSVRATYPRRGFGIGSRNSLSVRIDLPKNDLDFSCRKAANGYKVILHSPDELPEMLRSFFRLPLEQEILVSVKPNMLQTSQELKDYVPARKLCYLSAEKRLRFFKTYTQRHCELECMSNRMKAQCGCVLFSYPRDKQTPICGVGQHQCVTDVERELLEIELIDSLTDVDSGDRNCGCLPACTSLSYEYTLSPSKHHMNEHYHNKNQAVDDTKYTKSNIPAQLKVYFKQSEFIASQRVELYGLTYFLASCGGLLGLFVGVTALSFVEIVYYFTLRLAWTFRMYKWGKRFRRCTPKDSQ